VNLSWGNPVTPVTFMQAELENARESLDSFEGLALPHTNDLFRMASSLLRNRTEAEDAVQECLLQAWKSFDRFEPGTNCRAWLYKILFHVVSHHRRKWSRLWLAEDPQSLENSLVRGCPGVLVQRDSNDAVDPDRHCHVAPEPRPGIPARETRFDGPAAGYARLILRARGIFLGIPGITE